MPLRKSPRRTRALLAANRRNSRKSSGPRSLSGKRHSTWNAVRHGRRMRVSPRSMPLAGHPLKDFLDFYCKLSDAIIPAENLAGQQALLTAALRAWNAKRFLDRWINTRTQADWWALGARAVRPPSFRRFTLNRPGLSVPDWTVTIPVWLRWGRGPGRSRPSTPPDQDNDNGTSCGPRMHTPRMHAPRMHTMVSVHSTGPCRPAEALEGKPTELECARTKPESYSSQSASENMSVPADWDPAFVEAYALADRLIGWLMSWRKRTKPESFRKQEACTNMSPAGESGGRNPNGGDGATAPSRKTPPAVIPAKAGIQPWTPADAGVTAWRLLIPFGGPKAHRALGKVFRAMKTALVPRKEYSQLPLFQTKPECERKEKTSKIVSKSLDWLGTAVSYLLR